MIRVEDRMLQMFKKVSGEAATMPRAETYCIKYVAGFEGARTKLEDFSTFALGLLVQVYAEEHAKKAQ